MRGRGTHHCDLDPRAGREEADEDPVVLAVHLEHAARQERRRQDEQGRLGRERRNEPGPAARPDGPGDSAREEGEQEERHERGQHEGERRAGREADGEQRQDQRVARLVRAEDLEVPAVVKDRRGRGSAGARITRGGLDRHVRRRVEHAARHADQDQGRRQARGRDRCGPIRAPGALSRPRTLALEPARGVLRGRRYGRSARVSARAGRLSLMVVGGSAPRHRTPSA